MKKKPAEPGGSIGHGQIYHSYVSILRPLSDDYSHAGYPCCKGFGRNLFYC